MATATAARFRARSRARVPGDLSSSISRNAGSLPAQVAVDLRFSRRMTSADAPASTQLSTFSISSTGPTSPTSTTSSARAYPTNPSPTFGQFQQAGPPRQAQLALKVNF